MSFEQKNSNKTIIFKTIILKIDNDWKNVCFMIISRTIIGNCNCDEFCTKLPSKKHDTCFDFKKPRLDSLYKQSCRASGGSKGLLN